MRITPDECEARIKRDPKKICEALNESDHLHWSLSQIFQDTDETSRRERIALAVERAMEDYAGVMADEMNEIEDSANDELMDDPRRNQAAWIMGGAR